MVSVSLLNDAKPVYYLAHEIPFWVRQKVADSQTAKVGSSIRAFDMNFLAHQGWKVSGAFYDTSLMSLVVDDSFSEHGLKQQTKRLFGVDYLGQKNELDLVIERLGLKHVGELCALDIADPKRPYAALIGNYCCEDVENSRKVFLKRREHLRQQHDKAKSAGHALTPLNYFRDEMTPTESLLLELETNGVRIDKTFLDQLRAETIAERDEALQGLLSLCSEEIKKIERWQIEKVAATKKQEKTKQKVRDNPADYDCLFNINSPAHFGKLIYEELKCPFDLVKRTKKRAYLTKETHLKLILASVEPESKLALTLELYAAIKKTAKIINTYTGDSDKGIASLLQQRGTETWLFPQYKQRTATGRLSVFPIQQLPRKGKIKRFFIPSSSDNCFIYSDLSAIEFRNAAHLSQDSTMLKMIREGIDPHITLAARIFRIDESAVTKEQRNVGKTVNYLMLYGGGAGKLMQELALKNQLKFSKYECQQFLDATFELYSGYKAYLDALKNEMEETLQVVGVNGRVRHLPDIAFGRYLNHSNKSFFGPSEMRESLLEEPDERPKMSDLYYRARGRYQHAMNSGYNFPNQSLGGTEMKNALKKLKAAGFLIRASIHDAAIAEVSKLVAAEKAAEFKAIMESCYDLSVPIKSETRILQSFDEADLYTPPTAKAS
jgi:DNA polymerase I-like protein with 3'-5' exonuclease and polymerase domains